VSTLFIPHHHPSRNQDGQRLIDQHQGVNFGRRYPQLRGHFSTPIHSLNAKLRRAVRTRGHFPTDESALKLLFLVLNLAAKEWKMPPREWSMAKAQFAIVFEDRFSLA
jgi:transposase-like protein